MAIKCRKELMGGLYTGITTKHIVLASKMVAEYTGLHVKPHKAIVGANAFAHKSGIHQAHEILSASRLQDGMLKHKETYEIISPNDIGLSRSNESGIVLGKLRFCRSGRECPLFYYKAHIIPIKFKEKEEQVRATYGVNSNHWEYLCRECWPSARLHRYSLANKSNREANNINHHFGSKPAREYAKEWEAKYGTDTTEFELWKIGHEKRIYTEGPTKDHYECLSHNYETEISQGSDSVVASKRSFIAC